MPRNNKPPADGVQAPRVASFLDRRPTDPRTVELLRRLGSNLEPEHSGEVLDLLGTMLRCGRAPALDVLLALSRDEALADMDELTLHVTPREHARWWEKACALRAKYPGFQAEHWCRERMKYGNLPDANAPLSEYVRARISHAKALWSRDVANKATRLQFREWLRLHVEGETWIAPLWPDPFGWREALQILRIAYGLPRFAPAKPWSAGQ